MIRFDTTFGHPRCARGAVPGFVRRTLRTHRDDLGCGGIDGIGDHLVRLSVGLEHESDLMSDISAALARHPAVDDVRACDGVAY